MMKFLREKAVAVLLALLAGLGSFGVYFLNGFGVAAAAGTQPTKPKVYRANDKGVTPPTVIYKQDPNFASDLKSENSPSPFTSQQDKVMLEIVVGVDGHVTEVKAIQPFDKRLARLAVERVNTWKFNPALKDGKPVPCKLMVLMTFKQYR